MWDLIVIGVLYVLSLALFRWLGGFGAAGYAFVINLLRFKIAISSRVRVIKLPSARALINSRRCISNRIGRRTERWLAGAMISLRRIIRKLNVGRVICHASIVADPCR